MMMFIAVTVFKSVFAHVAFAHKSQRMRIAGRDFRKKPNRKRSVLLGKGPLIQRWQGYPSKSSWAKI